MSAIYEKIMPFVLSFIIFVFSAILTNERTLKENQCKTILVTCAAGYIWSHTCLRLLEEGYNLVVVDNYSNSSLEHLRHVKKLTGRDFKTYECNVCDKRALEEVFSENKIDAVIHFAWLKAIVESCKIPLKYYENNIYGTIALCETMQKFEVTKIVFISPSTVYGKNTLCGKHEDGRSVKSVWKNQMYYWGDFKGFIYFR